MLLYTYCRLMVCRLGRLSLLGLSCSMLIISVLVRIKLRSCWYTSCHVCINALKTGCQHQCLCCQQKYFTSSTQRPSAAASVAQHVVTRRHTVQGFRVSYTRVLLGTSRLVNFKPMKVYNNSSLSISFVHIFCVFFSFKGTSYAVMAETHINAAT